MQLVQPCLDSRPRGQRNGPEDPWDPLLQAKGINRESLVLEVEAAALFVAEGMKLFRCVVTSFFALASACPLSTKVTCPLCYDIMEQWNLDAAQPSDLDNYCGQVAGKWRSSYETLTDKPFVEAKERARCVAVAAGLQEVVRAGCALPRCNPDISCATFC